MNRKKCKYPFKLKQDSLCSEVGDAIGKMYAARQLKDRNEFMPNKKKEVAGPDLSSVRH